MLSSLLPVLYIKISPERLTVRNVKTGDQWSEVPELALTKDDKKVVLGFGGQARRAAQGQASEVINPFDHPRTLVGNFSVGEVLLRAAISSFHRKGYLALPFRAVVHPLGTPAGGYTQVELRALREMALGAGAAQVVMWVGRALLDQEVLSDEVLKSEG